MIILACVMAKNSYVSQSVNIKCITRVHYREHEEYKLMCKVDITNMFHQKV